MSDKEESDLSKEDEDFLSEVASDLPDDSEDEESLVVLYRDPMSAMRVLSTIDSCMDFDNYISITLFVCPKYCRGSNSEAVIHAYHVCQYIEACNYEKMNVAIVVATYHNKFNEIVRSGSKTTVLTPKGPLSFDEFVKIADRECGTCMYEMYRGDYDL